MWHYEPSTRRAILAAFFLLSLLPIADSPAAAVPVSLSHPIESGGALRVDCSHGRLRVIAGKAGVVRVIGEVGDGLRGAKLWPEAGALELRVSFPLMRKLRNLWQGEPRYRAELLIEVPADTRLILVSRDAEVEIVGLTGPVGVGVVSSSVEISGRPSRLEVETVTGSLSFEGATRSLRATTMSGALEVRGEIGRARLETVSGAIIVSRPVSDGELTTVSGDVTFGGGLAAHGELWIETESGNVDLRCCDEDGAEIDLLSRDGEIVNEIGAARPIRDARGHRRLALAIGDGDRRIEVRTRSGLIRLMPPSAE